MEQVVRASVIEWRRELINLYMQYYMYNLRVLYQSHFKEWSNYI